MNSLNPDPARATRPAAPVAPADDAERARRRRRLALAAGVSLPVFAAFAAFNGLANGAPRMAATSALAALLAAISLALLRGGAHERAAVHAFVLAFAVQVLGETAINGGLSAGAAPLIVLIVPAAILLGGMGAGRPWTAVVLIAGGALAVLDIGGHLPPSELPEEAMRLDRALSMFAGVLVSMVVVGLFERQSRETLAALAAERARLLHEATHDGLTGLPNRRMFREHVVERIRHARATGRPGALFYLDVDGFKRINDEFGHEAGDRLLVAFARRLRGRIGPDDFAARLSGDEFVVWADDCDALRAEHDLGRRLSALGDAPFVIGERTVQVAASVGVALTGAGGDLDALMHEADGAMYRAKAERRPDGARRPACAAVR